MNKNLLLCVGLFLASFVLPAQTYYDYLDYDSCKDLLTLDIANSNPINGAYWWMGENRYTKVANPDASDTQNPYVKKILATHVGHYIAFKLPETISSTEGYQFKLRYYAPASTTSGGFYVRFFHSSVGQHNNYSQVFVASKVDASWTEITGSLIPNGGLDYDTVVIYPLYNATSVEPLYIDDFQITVEPTASASVAATLESGNTWYDYPGGSSTSLNPIQGGTSTLDTTTNPNAEGLNSTTVNRVVNNGTDHVWTTYVLDAAIPNSGMLKFKVLADCTNGSDHGTVNVRLLNSADAIVFDSGENNQEVGYYAHANRWTDIEVDLSLASGGDIKKVHIFFDYFEKGTAGNKYYFDALQGPSLGAGSLSVNDKTLISTLKLYPNPVKDTFVLNKEVESARIYDVLGNLIQTINNKQTQFGVSNLTNGMYFIEVFVKNGKETIRFIKNN
ncbi:T9SS type A sorting domain-containing protein [Flavivirga spongiicola]|uniref:T9SS type A sorting domain-containing protein n=1 Tax=Flavivirga spongiicola TaxID=421621 RepID=A0ABU7XR44_9FLAO|nr:T9SS type A sorting domain-containing protein [Flavivirga sp. MEBiC05379]MDO5977898.1 T9SS type A sorting domain-containing protein [Flavivirga sp. MEBiC05379]